MSAKRRFRRSNNSTRRWAWTNSSLSVGPSGSYKLGIQFVDWVEPGRRYFHPFGTYGRPFDFGHLMYFWHQAQRQGKASSSLDDYCMAWVMASQARFAVPLTDPRSVLSTYDYAYHFDASLYAAFLREVSERRGVYAIEGPDRREPAERRKRPRRGTQLQDGREVSGELFIDCSGFRGLLIEEALHTGYEDWTHWLPCDRAVAVPCASAGDFLPYTRSTARTAGWQWRIPLAASHRQWIRLFSRTTSMRQVRLPRCSRISMARRWPSRAHCASSPGAGAGLEPQRGRASACRADSSSRWNRPACISSRPIFSGCSPCFPTGISPRPLRDEYNRIANSEVERVRDFLILHYHLNRRSDGELWRYCANMPIPDTLSESIEHFRRNARIVQREHEVFVRASWLAVQVGQLNLPEACDQPPQVHATDSVQWLEKMRATLHAEASRLPTHQQFIESNCRAAA